MEDLNLRGINQVTNHVLKLCLGLGMQPTGHLVVFSNEL